jgi:hypothetical protein
MIPANKIVEAALGQPKDVASVSVWDGAALYIDGKLASGHYTREMSDILEAVGVTVRQGLVRNGKLLQEWPQLLRDIPKEIIEWA